MGLLIKVARVLHTALMFFLGFMGTLDSVSTFTGLMSWAGIKTFFKWATDSVCEVFEIVCYNGVFCWCADILGAAAQMIYDTTGILSLESWRQNVAAWALLLIEFIYKRYVLYVIVNHDLKIFVNDFQYLTSRRFVVRDLVGLKPLYNLLAKKVKNVWNSIVTVVRNVVTVTVEVKQISVKAVSTATVNSVRTVRNVHKNTVKYIRTVLASAMLYTTVVACRV